MFSKVLKVMASTTPLLMAATPVVNTSEAATAAVSLEEKKMRRSELPIYPKEECQCKKAPLVLKEESNAVLDGIGVVRSEIQNLLGQSTDVINKSVYVINTGIAHSSAQIDFLRDEDNLVARIGAITAGSLLGFLFAIRRGFFKKLLYTTAGGLTAASVCYPSEAEVYTGIALSEAKKYGLVGYHFLNGVSKDLIGYEFPELPKPTDSTPVTKALESKPVASMTVPAPPLDVPKPSTKV